MHIGAHYALNSLNIFRTRKCMPQKRDVRFSCLTHSIGIAVALVRKRFEPRTKFTKIHGSHHRPQDLPLLLHSRPRDARDVVE